jgi:hypothetical protein
MFVPVLLCCVVLNVIGAIGKTDKQTGGGREERKKRKSSKHVVSTPISYSGGPGFKSRPADRLFW